MPSISPETCERCSRPTKLTGPHRREGRRRLVLKRLDDALRDGDRVYAIIRDVQTVRSRKIGPAEPDDAMFSSHGSAGSVQSVVGRPGSATGLAAVVRGGALSLSSDRSGASPRGTRAGRTAILVEEPDRRSARAEVHASGLGGTSHVLRLEAVEDQEQPHELTGLERAQPLSGRRHAIFALEADDRRGSWSDTRELIDWPESIRTLPSRASRDSGGTKPARRFAATGHGSHCRLRCNRYGAGSKTAVRTIADGRELDAATSREADLAIITPRLPLGSPPAPSPSFTQVWEMFSAGMGVSFALSQNFAGLRTASLESMRDQFLPELWWQDPLPGRVSGSPPADPRTSGRQQPCHRDLSLLGWLLAGRSGTAWENPLNRSWRWEPGLGATCWLGS